MSHIERSRCAGLLENSSKCRGVRQTFCHKMDTGNGCTIHAKTAVKTPCYRITDHTSRQEISQMFITNIQEHFLMKAKDNHLLTQSIITNTITHYAPTLIWLMKPKSQDTVIIRSYLIKRSKRNAYPRWCWWRLTFSRL